jgi:hypothetical protein
MSQSAGADTHLRNAGFFIVLQGSQAGDSGEMDEDRGDVESAAARMLVLYQVANIPR